MIVNKPCSDLFRTPISLVLALFWLLSSAPGWSDQTSKVAQIVVATGDVTAINKDHSSRPLVAGSPLYQGDTVVTGNGETKIRFVDNTRLSLSKKTRFALNDYLSSMQEEKNGEASFSLVNGLLHTLTGKTPQTLNAEDAPESGMAMLGVRGGKANKANQKDKTHRSRSYTGR